jgi:hypothetical protein
MRMEPEVRSRFLELANRQDSLMNSISAELGTKTLLHLVFTAFLFGSGVQTVNIAVNALFVCRSFVVLASGISLGLSMLAAVCFLFAARIKKYETLPSLQALIDFTYEQAEEDRPRQLDEAVIFDLAEIVESNKASNERVGEWIKIGGRLLVGSTGFLGISSAVMIFVLLTRPS